MPCLTSSANGLAVRAADSEPELVDNPEYTRRASTHALLAVVLGVGGFALCGLLTGALAVNLANRALAAAADDVHADNYLVLAQLGRVLGYVAIGLWAVAAALVLVHAVFRV